MEAEDGLAFIKNLAYFVRTHEKALANAQLLQRRDPRSNNGSASSPLSPSSTPLKTSSFAFLPFTSRPVQPAKLTLTPHHLFYLLSRFQELSISVGAMDVRLENIHAEAAPNNYVSFLNQAQRRKLHGNDAGSIHSVSSIRSAISTMTSLWSTLGLSSKSESKKEKYKAQEKVDLKYLYSAFTMVPCLKLSPDYKAPLIAGYEEFPFETAVPLFVFKNVSALEISDVDFRQFYGWDRLSENLRSLTLRRASVEDLADVLINVVLDDIDKRRRRSARTAPSPVVPQSGSSPRQRHSEIVEAQPARSPKASVQPFPQQTDQARSANVRPRSTSPEMTPPSRPGSVARNERNTTPVRRSSGGSLSERSATPRSSSTTLLTYNHLPHTKWRFLQHLSLCDNSLTSLTTTSLLPIANTLKSLDLSHNLFAEIPDCLASLVSLRALNLSSCMIESLHSLVRSPLPAITALNLRNNRLTSLAGVERLLSLERIDLRENRLSDPTEFARIAGIPNIIDLYVNKNPFVKAYTNHRVTIFNIFRSTPGYTDDVYIEGSQPTYSERKYLVDRVPEPINLPMIRYVAPEPPLHHFDSTANGIPPEESSPQLSRRGSTASQRRRKTDRGHSTKKKKGSRRRIVDIAAQTDVFAEPARSSVEIPHTPASSSITAPPLLDPPAPIDEPELTDEPTPLEPSSIDLNTVPESTKLTSPTQPQHTQSDYGVALLPPPLLRAGSDPTFDPLPTSLGLDSDRYRQKIESLRNDFGSAWLSALSDEQWERRIESPLGSPFSQTSGLGHPPSLARTVSQSIVSGGRTLG